MIFATVNSLATRKHAQLLVLPFWHVKKHAEAAASIGQLQSEVSIPLEMQDFAGKEGEILFLYPSSKQPERRIALLGLGDKDKISVEKLRRAYANLAKACRAKKIKDVNILMPKHAALTKESVLRGSAEGLLLANYAYENLKNDSIKENPTVFLSKATFIGIGQEGVAIAQKYAVIAEAVYFARDLVNGNADDVTPQYLSQCAQKLATELPRVKTIVFNRKRIEQEKMGLILAVSRGSTHDPAFIIVEYKGLPKSKDLTVFIGKGVTYDTGGLNLKAVASMATMKGDMGGGAAVLGIIYAAAKLKLPINVTAIVPAVENAIGSGSYKPGDVYTSYTGKTVEIIDTDAEGRLILADALGYAVKHLKPTRIIDMATLTGAVEVALGNETSGVMSNQDALADSLIRAGHETYERLWRLPLYEEYRAQLNSDVADIKNSGGRVGGAITAALFLKEFVNDIPWAHCDIAGTAYLSEARRYHPKYGTGFGVRLMIEFLENL